MMVETCPGRMSASRATSGSLTSASSVGGTVLCAVKTLKLRSPSRAARRTAAAMSGVVVSKPTPTNTTSRSGFSVAIFSASSGEYTMRTSRPAACSADSELVEPGTRFMSPKVVRTRPSMRASAMTVSMSRLAVTHTGQPGPLIRRTPGGRMDRKPLRAMATV